MRKLRMAQCLGEFDCWVKTPGVCHTRDEGREIARAVHDADALFIAGPTSFGGYPSEAKKALDRNLGLILPFFVKRSAQTHHTARYARLASLYAALWHPHPTAELQAILERLVARNAINMFAPGHGAVLLGQDATKWPVALDRLVALARQAGPIVEVHPGHERAVLLEAAAPAVGPADQPSNVVLLVGSARPRGESTSEVLGRRLAGTAAKVHFVGSELVHDDGRFAGEALAADLLVLATPLYIDSLPFLVTRALEHVAARARHAARKPRFAAVINCGFPEAEQCIPAVQIARAFAAEAGMPWAGAIALGGGGMIDGQPLQKLGAFAEPLRVALDEAAAALRRGEGIPPDAIEKCSRPLVAPWIYRAASNLGWWQQARKHGVRRAQLTARPFDAV